MPGCLERVRWISSRASVATRQHRRCLRPRPRQVGGHSTLHRGHLSQRPARRRKPLHTAARRQREGGRGMAYQCAWQARRSAQRPCPRPSAPTGEREYTGGTVLARCGLIYRRGQAATAGAARVTQRPAQVTLLASQDGIALVRRLAFSRGQDVDIAEHVRSSQTCQRSKAEHGGPRGPCPYRCAAARCPHARRRRRRTRRRSFVAFACGPAPGSPRPYTCRP